MSVSSPHIRRATLLIRAILLILSLHFLPHTHGELSTTAAASARTRVGPAEDWEDWKFSINVIKEVTDSYPVDEPNMQTWYYECDNYGGMQWKGPVYFIKNRVPQYEALVLYIAVTSALLPTF